MKKIIYRTNLKRNASERKLIRKNPWGDRDGDQIPNWVDCKPYNRKKQGLAGAIGGLLAVAITAKVAGDIIKGTSKNIPRNKRTTKKIRF